MDTPDKTPDKIPEFQTPEFQTLHDAMVNLDTKLAKQTIYMHALEFAILYHCSGKQVPDDIAEIVPQYSRYLNKAGCCRKQSTLNSEPSSANNEPSDSEPSANSEPSNSEPIADDDLLNIISKDTAGI